MDQLLVDFKAVRLVKKQLTVSHSNDLFQRLSAAWKGLRAALHVASEDVVNVGVSIRCVPSQAPNQVGREVGRGF